MKPGKDILKSVLDPFELDPYYDNKAYTCPYAYRALQRSVERFVKYSIYLHVERTVWLPIQSSIVVRIRYRVSESVNRAINESR